MIVFSGEKCYMVVLVTVIGEPRLGRKIHIQQETSYLS